MLIDDYFDQLENIINSCGYIQTKIVHKDKRSDYVGYFRADLYFHDDSLLHVREFISTRVGVVKGTYTYHYQDSSNRIIFRYDNTEHFPDLPNFPHHKHTISGPVGTFEPNLQDVIDEIVAIF